MAILIAAVAVVGVLCVLDLLMTFGVLRRLREHTELIKQAGAPRDVPVTGLLEGEPPAPFVVDTTDGGRVSGAQGLRMVAFFSSSCSVCPERVEPFLSYLGAHHLAREDVLAVVIGSEQEPPGYLGQLAEAARVSVAGDDNVVMGAFKVFGFPAFCLLGVDGTVQAASYDPDALPMPVAV